MGTIRKLADLTCNKLTGGALISTCTTTKYRCQPINHKTLQVYSAFLQQSLKLQLPLCCLCMLQTPWVRVHAKIHGIDPDQIPADFLAEINKSMLFYRTHIVSVGVRASCIELIIDMQMRACNSRTTSEFPLSYQHDNCPPTQRWGSEDGQSLPVLRPGSAVGSDDSPAGISHDTIADSYPQLQSLDWLHLLQQHLPPPAEDAQPAASDRWISLRPTHNMCLSHLVFCKWQLGSQPTETISCLQCN